MSLMMQPRGGARRGTAPKKGSSVGQGVGIRPDVVIALDEVTDLGCLLPPGGDAGCDLHDDGRAAHDPMGDVIVPEDDGTGDVDATPGARLPAVPTRWRPFIGHEMTANTRFPGPRRPTTDFRPRKSGRRGSRTSAPSTRSRRR